MLLVDTRRRFCDDDMGDEVGSIGSSKKSSISRLRDRGPPRGAIASILLNTAGRVRGGKMVSAMFPRKLEISPEAVEAVTREALGV